MIGIINDRSFSYKLGSNLCLERYCSQNCSQNGLGGGGGNSPIKMTGVFVGNFEKEPLKGTRISISGRGPN